MLPGGLLEPIPVMAEGVTYNWTGDTKDGYWHTPGNWKVGEDAATVEPGNGDTVIIPKLSVVESVYNTNEVILQCEGDLTVSGGTLNTSGASTISGKLVNNGKVTVTGSSWDSLTLSGGGEGSGDFDVAGGKKLKFTGGTFTVGGNINDLGNSASVSVDVSAPATSTEVTINGSYKILGSTMVGMGAKVEWKGTVNYMGKLTNYGEANFYRDVTIKPLNLVGGTVYNLRPLRSIKGILGYFP